MTHASRRGAGMRRVERALFIAGVYCMGWVIGTWSYAQWYQWHALRQFAASTAIAALPQPAADPLVATAIRGDNALVGVLGIPRLAVSLAVLEGDDSRTLAVAAGHLPDTPLPWAVGNTAVAGHRDTFFRLLERVSVGDDVQFATRYGTYAYRVRRLTVVDAADVSVLRPSTHAGLTLITCYPFDYVGPAPRRFIVQAERIAQ